MTVHLSANHLRCHHCGSVSPIVHRCGGCGSDRLEYKGVGTQRLESFLQQRFPGVSVFRVDRDNTRNKDGFDRILEQVKETPRSILVGTQMLAKGHHLPNVTLVVVLDADASLASTDYRGNERLAQLVLQVTGRAGREQKPGIALVQTHYPEHPLLASLIHQDYSAIAQMELEERKLLQLPPFSYQALFRLEDKSEQQAFDVLHQVRGFMEQQGLSVFCIGPFPAPLQRRAGFYRYQLLLQAGRRSELAQLVNLVLVNKSNWVSGQHRFSVDIDPQDMA